MRASHIKAWRESFGEERLNIDNGLMLCAIHDALFSRELISFAENGNIIISVFQKDKEIQGLVDNIFIKMSQATKAFMKWHIEKLLKESENAIYKEYRVGLIIEEVKTTLRVHFTNVEGELMYWCL